MKLFEYLETLPKDSEVNIGTVMGSAFIYYGAIDREKIENAFKTVYDQITEYFKRYDGRVKYHENNVERWSELIGKRPTKEVNENMSYSMRKIVELDKLKIQHKERMEAFKMPEDREVVEHYKSVLTKNTTIVLVEGDEVGAYWFKGDIERRLKNNG